MFLADFYAGPSGRWPLFPGRRPGLYYLRASGGPSARSITRTEVSRPHTPQTETTERSTQLAHNGVPRASRVVLPALCSDHVSFVGSRPRFPPANFPARGLLPGASL